jgi:hypothetical protein
MIRFSTIAMKIMMISTKEKEKLERRRRSQKAEETYGFKVGSFQTTRTTLASTRGEYWLNQAQMT